MHHGALLATTGAEAGVNLWDVVTHGGMVGKSIMLVLVGFSLVSWVIIAQKAMLLKRSRAASDGFRAAFRKATNWTDLRQHMEKFNLSPLVGLFGAGFGEVTYQLKVGQTGGKAQLRSMEAVERSLQRASVVEIGRMEKHLGILASIAAVSPFVGLLGTVWGIIEAFHGIGRTGQASLTTVAIPISEALVATAIGLVAAIPALLAYNYFQGQLKGWQTELDDFALEFIGLSERNFT